MKKWILFLIILFAFSELNAQSVGDVMTWKGQYLRPGYLPPNWNYLTNKPSTFTATAHGFISAYHTASGLTPGHFLKALTSTTFGFAAHGLSYTDVGAAASGHNHTGVYQPVITLLSTALGGTNFNGYDQGDTNNFMMYDQNGDRLIPSGYTRYSFSLSGHTHATSSTKITTDTLFFSGDGLIDGNGDITTPFRGIFWGDPYRVWTEIADVADTAKKILVSGSPPTYRKINGDFIDDTAKVGYAGTNGYLLQADSSNNIKNSPFTITGIPESLAAVRAYAVAVADIGVDPYGDPTLYKDKTGGWSHPTGGGGGTAFDIINVDSFAVNAWYDTITNSNITYMDRWDAHVYYRTPTHSSYIHDVITPCSQTGKVIFALSDTSSEIKRYWYGRAGTIVDTVAGGQSGFDPRSIEGDGVFLRGYYDPQQESYANDADITTIHDYSPSAYDLPSIGVGYAKFKTGGINNKPYFYFNATTSQALYRIDVASPPGIPFLLGVDKSFTIFIASTNDSVRAYTQTEAIILGFDNLSSAGPYHMEMGHNLSAGHKSTYWNTMIKDTTAGGITDEDNRKHDLTTGTDSIKWRDSVCIITNRYVTHQPKNNTSDTLQTAFNALQFTAGVESYPTIGDEIECGKRIVVGGWKHGTEAATDFFGGRIYGIIIYEGALSTAKRKYVLDNWDALFLTPYVQ